MVPALLMSFIIAWPSLPVNWLMIYNANDSRSVADAQWYINQRNLNANLMAINFGATSEITLASFSNASIFSCQSASYHGINDTSFNGLSIQAAINAYGASHDVDGYLLSTYTPITVSDNPIPTPLPALCATQTNDSLPHGRIGAPWYTGSEFDCTREVQFNGEDILRNAVLNAQLSELVDNRHLAHWFSNTLEYLAGSNLNIGVPIADNAATLSYAQSQGFDNIVNLGTTYPFRTAAANDWINGTITPTPSLFAYIIGVSLNQLAAPGSLPYSKNYVATPGAWGYDWTSFSWQLALDILAHGGSAGCGTVGEPFAEGNIEPSIIFKNLVLNRVSLCQAASVGANNYAYLVPSARFQTSKTTTFGDPLYRPYASTFISAAAVNLSGQLLLSGQLSIESR